jgi:magnesium transporter
VLGRLQPVHAMNVLRRMPEELSELVVSDVTSRLGELWATNREFPADSVGRLMDPPAGVFGMGVTVRRAIEQLREFVKSVLVVYGYVVDDEGKLQGIIVMRDLLLADPDELLIDIMVPEPFHFEPETSVSDAMHAVVHRHYPVYPVCDAHGHLLGLVQGYVLFEEQAIEMSAQPGRMVGVEKEEHLATPWPRSLRFRHPWLQLNLLTAFAAAFVVGLFEHTIEQLVVLAAFLPVLAGQSGNTGCQALAVTLRALTLGELTGTFERRVIFKEATLGVLNGMLVGLTAGLAMYIYARLTDSPAAMTLALVVFLAMTGSCLASGVTGVLVPLSLKRLGADPATASTIFLTTATDVASMGLLLGLATLLVL